MDQSTCVKSIKWCSCVPSFFRRLGSKRVLPWQSGISAKMVTTSSRNAWSILVVTAKPSYECDTVTCALLLGTVLVLHRLKSTSIPPESSRLSTLESSLQQQQSLRVPPNISQHHYIDYIYHIYYYCRISNSILCFMHCKSQGTWESRTAARVAVLLSANASTTRWREATLLSNIYFVISCVWL